MKTNRRAEAQLPEIVFVIFIVGFVVLGVVAFLTRNRLTTGEVIAKEHFNPSTSLGIDPIIGSNDGGFVVSQHSEPEKWVFVVRGTHEGATRVERHEVDRYEWESAKVGDSWRKNE